MPFGMKNAPAQKLINALTSDLEGCEGYINDVVVYNDTWMQHVQRLRVPLKKLARAKLNLNLLKSEFRYAQVVLLEHVIGQGYVTPVQAKVEAIVKHLVPTNKQHNSCVSLVWPSTTVSFVGTFVLLSIILPLQ